MTGRSDLVGLLERARASGLLGPGPVADQIEHARAWARGLGEPPAAFLDLGSGGGLPGLVLAAAWPAARAVLLDARRRPAEWLRTAVVELDLGDRVRVVEARAEAAGREPDLRERFPLVVARSFAGPAVTAECGAPFVAPGGRLSVSEPPGADPGRWPAAELADLGLRRVETARPPGASFVVLARVGPLDERWPRAVGRPGKRPRWS